MRIAMVGDEFVPDMGGVPLYTLGLSTALAKLGAEPVIITHAHQGQTERDEFHGIEVRRLRGFVVPCLNRAVSPALAHHLHTHLKFDGFDVVHGQDIHSSMALLSILLAHRRKIPSVLTCHSVRESLGAWRVVYQPITLIVKRADGILAVGEAARELYIGLGVSDTKVKVIPNGVDLSLFNPNADGSAIRAQLGIGQDPLVATAMRLIKRKGPRYLIDAFAMVLQAIPDVKLAIAGQGSDAAHLSTRLRRLGIQKSVFMLGKLSREEVANLMAAADVFVLPSLLEAFSLVLLEAMAVGTPVVCTRTQGALGIVEGGVNGSMVPPADVATLADAIVRTLSDRRLAERFRANGLKTARGFSWEKTARRTLALYETVCEEHAKCRTYG